MITTLIVIMMVLIYLSIFFGHCAKSTFDNGRYIVITLYWQQGVMLIITDVVGSEQ